MINSYNRTLFKPDLTKATFELYLTDEVKYDVDDLETEATKVTYKGVKSWDLIEGGPEAEEIEKYSDMMDEEHAYLVLHLSNGETATFRNTHVTMFIW